MKRPRGIIGLALLVPLCALGARGRAHAQPARAAAAPAAAAADPGIARLFGVAPGSPRSELTALARRAEVPCHAAPAAPNGPVPVVCNRPPVPAPILASVTYWYADGALDRAFLVDALGSPVWRDYASRFSLLELWATRALGTPTVPAQHPPEWRDARHWERGGAVVDLWLADEAGMPRLVLAARARGAAVDCGPGAITDALLDLFPPASDAARARAAHTLADCRVARATGALWSAMEHDGTPEVQAEALRSLSRLGTMPTEQALADMAARAPAPLASAAKEIIDGRAAAAAALAPASPAGGPAAPPAAAAAPARDAVATGPRPSPGAESPAQPLPSGALPGAPRPALPELQPPGPVAEGPMLPPAPPPPPPEPARPRGPIPGTPLAIGASTVAGAALMRNLGLMGGDGLAGATPQILLGSAGAVIGFGTSWGLARFGFRPTIEQASWFTNTTAWGTLAGLMAWSASDSTSPKLQYGSLVLGEAAGMGLGVWSAQRWKWTLPQIALADSFVLGAGLSSFGVGLIRDPNPKVTVTAAVGAPLAMVASAIVAYQMSPTTNDLHLMTFGALASGWTGGLLGAGLSGTEVLGSHQSQGGAVAGLGFGYLAAAAVGTFTESDAASLGAAAGGVAAGNLLGLGLHLTVQGFTHANPPGATFTPEELNHRSLSAAIGGALLGGAAYAYAPHLHLGPSALSMTLSGSVYGAGTWWLASLASYHGQPVTDVSTAALQGGLLVGATLGGMSGLVASRWFSPDAADQATTAAATGLGMAGGLGAARLFVSDQGTPDAVGVLAGAAAGFAGGAWAAHSMRLRAPDAGAGVVGLGAGALIGTLLPSLGDAQWNADRKAGGGAMLGLSLGALGATAAAHLTNADAGQVAAPSLAGVLGLGIGVGTGLAWPCPSSGCTSQAPRIGAVAGPLALAAGALLAEPKLHLSDGLGPAAPELALSGAVLGGAWGVLAAGVLDPSGLVGHTPDRALWGGVLAGGSAGLASGLVLSQVYAPTGGDLGLVFASSVWGAGLGFGIPLLASPTAGRHDTVGTLGGSVSAMVAGSLIAPHLELRPPDITASFLGMSAGALVGTLVPSLGRETWDDGRRAGGGALVGAAVGAAGGLAASYLDGASGAEVGIVGLGMAVGLGTGAGAGWLWTGTSSQPPRIGTVAGVAGGLGLGLLGNAALHLDEGLGPNAGALGSLGGLFGATDGVLLAGALDPSGLVSRTPARQAWGGALMGASAEIGAGLALSKYVRLREGDGVVLAGGKLLGGALGLGVSMIAIDHTGRPDTVSTLAGSVAGLGAAAVVQTVAPVDKYDEAAGATGAAFGGFIGALAPTLGETTWGGLDRRLPGGGLLAGLSGGAMAGALLRHATDATPATIGLTALGGADGLATGLGIGLLADTGEGDRPERIGMVAGAGAGLAVGALAWPRLTLGEDGVVFTTAATFVGGWTGLWLPALGHADRSTVRDNARGGGLLAGGGLASFGASLLAPVVRPDRDMVVDAAAVDAIWTGAGAGVGALVSTRDDAPVWGMLGAGTAGLLLGGALHRSIEIDGADAPLLTLASAEGLWLGGWLPSLLSDQPVTDRQRLGGLAAGGLGGLGLATVASGAIELEPARAGFAALGSGLGASIGGGIALLSPELHDRQGVGIMLGGTAAGLVAGSALTPRLRLASPGATVGAAAAGGTLGLSEALLFAWSGRASGSEQYGGAALLGGGIGAGLGMAAVTTLDDPTSEMPPAAGFAAWGAWMGSFSGSLVHNDAHDIVTGGLIGANVGFVSGYALLRTGTVEPRDFGWLSLFGAMGTVAGAAAGAPFSSKAEPAPLLAGLAVGPAVGMLTGALVLPRLRRWAAQGSQVSWSRMSPSTVRGFRFDDRAPDKLTLSSQLLDAPNGPGSTPSLLRRLSSVVDVTQWAPMIGALPTAEETGPPPLLFGVTGLWK